MKFARGARKAFSSELIRPAALLNGLGPNELSLSVIPCISPADVVGAGKYRKDQGLENGTQR